MELFLSPSAVSTEDASSEVGNNLSSISARSRRVNTFDAGNEPSPQKVESFRLSPFVSTPGERAAVRQRVSRTLKTGAVES